MPPPAPALLSRLTRRAASGAYHGAYTSWGRMGRLSGALAGLVALGGPPVLLLSLPRSGSSWVGAVLGSAANALYLREPVSQQRRAAGEPYTVVDVPASRPPVLVRAASDLAFAGIPAFPPEVISTPRQWSLGRRRRGRPVIKEVNPLACAFWLQHYRPHVILLVRHPAAVALSYSRLGWLGNEDVQADTDDPRHTVWEKSGMRQGHVHRSVLSALEGYPDHRIVQYEDLCQAPAAAFEALFAFAGLEWSAEVVRFIASSSTDAAGRHPYGTRRDSKRMADSWRGRLPDEDLAALRRGYLRYGLPWYSDPEDW